MKVLTWLLRANLGIKLGPKASRKQLLFGIAICYLKTPWTFCSNLLNSTPFVLIWKHTTTNPNRRKIDLEDSSPSLLDVLDYLCYVWPWIILRILCGSTSWFWCLFFCGCWLPLSHFGVCSTEGSGEKSTNLSLGALDF